MNKGRTLGAVSLSKIVIVAVVAAAIVGVVAVKQANSGDKPAQSAAVPPQTNVPAAQPAVPQSDAATKPAETAGQETADTPAKTEDKKLPKLVDLGAGKCIPCKAMKPILDGLREEYRGKFDVVFIDVWENREAGSQYGIRVIPTQIFYDETGKERFRHEGFFSREDILKTWKDLGYTFE